MAISIRPLAYIPGEGLHLEAVLNLRNFGFDPGDDTASMWFVLSEGAKAELGDRDLRPTIEQWMRDCKLWSAKSGPRVISYNDLA